MDESDETGGSGIDGKRDRGSETNLLARVSETAEEVGQPCEGNAWSGQLRIGK